ncbi:MAG: glycosyl hydrolase family 28-related protein, partial [Acidimicrobiia bacterium]
MHNKPGHLGARFFARTLLRLGFLIALTALLAGTGFVGTAASETGVYDVRAYGARGDGVSNDSAAIQAAINAASAVGGTVTVPAGTFAVNSTISLKSGVTVRGAGIDRTILSMPNQSAPTNLLRGSGVNNVSIMDLSLSSPAASGFVFAIGLTNDYSNVTVERVKVTGCQYALKADTQGKNLTVRDFTARASGQIYISNLTGGLFERLDLEMVTQKLTAVTFHAIYMGANNHNLTFRTINLTGGSGFTLQLYTDSGWTLPSDNISFDGLTVEGRWAVVIGSGFQGVTFRNVTAHASLADSPVFSLYDPRDVTVDGFAAAGGNALISARVASPQVIRFQNGTYDGASLPSFPWLTTTNVRLGAASATTTTAPLNATAS